MSRRTVATTVTIRSTPQRVYDVLVDLTTWPTLDPTLLEMTPRDPLAIGSHGTMVNRRAGGMRITTAWDIVELIPGSRYKVRIVGRGYELVETVDLASADGGTTIAVNDDLWSTSLSGRIMVPMSTGIIRRDLERRLGRLKEMLESPPDGQPIGQ
jgi:hypothetical protein